MNQVEHDNFKIVCSLNKAYEYHDLESREQKYRLQGMASGTRVDREGERMTQSVIESFMETIHNGIVTHNGEWSYVPLVSEHRRNGVVPEWDQTLGHLVKAWTDDEWNLWIEAELDMSNPSARHLFDKLTRPPEKGKPISLGLSIGGVVLDASQEWDDQLGKSVYTYNAVSLSEVTVTSAPAYPTRYLQALQKSVDWTKVESNSRSDDMETNKKNTTLNIDDAFVSQEDVVKSDESVVDTQDDQSNPNVEVDEVTPDADDQSEDAVVEDEESAVDEQGVEEEQVEEEDSEITEKSEEQVKDEGEAYVTADAFEALKSMVEELSNGIKEVQKSVQDGLIIRDNEDDDVEDKPEEPTEVEPVGDNDEVEESVEEEASQEVEEEEIPVTDPVERSASVNLEDLVTLMSTKFSEKLDEKITELSKSFDQKFEEFANEEVDKSIVPSRANDLDKSYSMNEDEQFRNEIKDKNHIEGLSMAIDKAFQR